METLILKLNKKKLENLILNSDLNPNLDMEFSDIWEETNIDINQYTKTKTKDGVFFSIENDYLVSDTECHKLKHPTKQPEIYWGSVLYYLSDIIYYNTGMKYQIPPFYKNLNRDLKIKQILI